MTNTITVVGTLVRDPELRYTSEGHAVCSFTAAYNARKKEGDKWVDGPATFFRCTAWRDLAENVAATLSKGDRAIVEGRMTARKYTDKNGNEREGWDVQVEAVGPELRFATAQVERAKRSGGGNSAGGGSGTPPAQPTYSDEEPF